MSKPGGVRLTLGLATYLLVLIGGAVGVGVWLHLTEAQGPGAPTWTVLPILAALLIVAEYLLVRFRYKQEVDALNLIESVLAPMLFAFPGAAVVATMGAAQFLGAVLRPKNSWVKSTFNIAQWSLAAGAGALVLAWLSSGEGVTGRNMAVAALATLAVSSVNQVAIIGVMSIVHGAGIRHTLHSLVARVLPAWIGGLGVNILIGSLYILAYDSNPWAVVLFPVPLVVMHLAYRGYAAARADRTRLAGLHRSAQALSEPLDPREAIEGYLSEVAECFEAAAAALVLRVEGGREIHHLQREGEEAGRVRVSYEAETIASLEGALLAQPRALHVQGGQGAGFGVSLREHGWRDLAAAPLYDGSHLVGVLVVYDQAGLEGTSGGELAVLTAMAREAAGMFAKGRLLESVLEERRKLDEIVSSTSDGILTLADDGTIRSWNKGFEMITGVPGEQVVGRAAREALRDLGMRGMALGGVELGPVELASWADGGALPSEVRIERNDGARRRLACSYSYASDAAGVMRTLVVVARDVTPDDEIETLREQFERLVEVESAQRLVVEQLQQAVMPERPEVAGADMVVEYLPSDPSAPTGGDLYDWQVLPDGEVHIAVVDVLGHGVAATKAALAVVHALRLVTVGGTALEDVVEEADRLLGALHPDLVATVVLGRYDPRTGRVRVASGGHPPAIVTSPRGEAYQLTTSGGAIGWPGAGTDLIAEVTLEPGDSLVFYTDGLVEARKDILEGMEVLVGHARDAAALPAPEFARTLVERSLAGAMRRDDTLALVLRRLPVSAKVQRKSWRVEPDKREARNVRHKLEAFCNGQGVDNPDISFVAAELLANAVEFARSEVSVSVEVSSAAEGSEREVVVEVSDDGRGSERLRSGGVALPDVTNEHGRGLYIIRQMSREVSVLSTSEGSIIRCVLPAVEQSEEQAEAALAASVMGDLDLEGLDL